jgi:hypothetical protein
MMWALTFLTSTWYLKNPFLKSKIVEVSVVPFPLFRLYRLNYSGTIVCLLEMGRTEEYPRDHSQYASDVVEVSHGCINTFLHWCVSFGHLDQAAKLTSFMLQR